MITWVRVMIKAPKGVYSLLLSLLFRKREIKNEKGREKEKESKS